MISQISIQGLALIDSLTIEFSQGFNVITGETGAGKSILIKALGFLMGGKAGAEAVRAGANQATVSAAFHLPSKHRALVLLENLGVPLDSDEGGISLIIRRQLTNKGRSQSWVNDVPVTTQALRELGTSLVDIFGQHENQKLLEESRHVDYLDSFLPEPHPLVPVVVQWSKVQAHLGNLRDSVKQLAEGLKNKDYLEYRAEELKTFDPTVKDFESIEVACRSAEEGASLKEGLLEAQSCLEGQDTSLSQALFELARRLTGIKAQESITKLLLPLREQAQELAKGVDELSYNLSKLVSTVDVDETELENAQNRLYGYQDLLRKHGLHSVNELVETREKIETELKMVLNAGDLLLDSMNALDALTQDLVKFADRLTKLRKKAAGGVKTRVEKELSELAMPGARFEVEFVPTKRSLEPLDIQSSDPELLSLIKNCFERLSNLSDKGAESIRFLLSANKGEPPLPLTRIASGGELSRIMLAFKKAIAVDADTCVLVFDEIDTGISGRVADVVGRKMSELSEHFQVVCISHLPQVAVYADTHFLVQKKGKKDRTETEIIRLTEEGSAQEVARLLSGSEVSRSSLENARTLIQKVKKRGRTNLSKR